MLAGRDGIPFARTWGEGAGGGMMGRVSDFCAARKLLGESPVQCEVYTGLMEREWSFILAALAGVCSS